MPQVEPVLEEGFEALRLHEPLDAPVPQQQTARLKNISLSDLDSLISVAAKEKYIREDQIQEIIDFRDNPEDVSWMKGEK